MLNLRLIELRENKPKPIPKKVYNINVKGNFDQDEIAVLVYNELKKARLI